MEDYNKHMSGDPDIPEGLEYRDDYWQDALKKIERHERREAAKRWAWISFALLFVLGSAAGIWWNIERSTQSFVEHVSPTLPQQQQQPADTSLTSPTHDPTTASDTPISTAGSLDTVPATIPAEAHVSIANKDPQITASKPATTPTYRQQEVITNNADAVDFLSTPAPRPTEVAAVPPAADKRVEGFASQSIATMSASTETEPSIARGIAIATDSTADVPMLRDDATVGAQQFPSAPYAFVDRIAPKSARLLPNHAGLMVGHYLPYTAPWIEPRWRMNAYVGLSLVTHYSSPLRDVKTDPMVGVRMEFNPNKRLALRGGLEYFSIGNVRRPYTSTSVAYDINYIRTVTTVETHQLYYLSLPLTVAYRLHPRHQVWWGGGVSYMLTGRNEIYLHRVTPNEQRLIDHYEDNGFVSGFVDFPWFVHVGYEWRFRKNAFVGIGYQYGLTDITRNDYFGVATTDRNTRIMITLGVDCFKHE